MPEDVKEYLKLFAPDQNSPSVKKGILYLGFKNPRGTGTRLLKEQLIANPKSLIAESLANSLDFVEYEGNIFQLYYPSTFTVVKAKYEKGKIVNCCGIIIEHLFNIKANLGLIESKDVKTTID